MHMPEGQAACHINGLQARPLLNSATVPSAAAAAAAAPTASLTAIGTYQVTWQASDPCQDGYQLAPAGACTRLPADVMGACAKLLQGAQQMALKSASARQGSGLILGTKGTRPTLGPVLSTQLSKQLLLGTGLASLMRTIAMENLNLNLNAMDVSPLQRNVTKDMAIIASSKANPADVGLNNGVYGASSEASVHHLAVLDSCSHAASAKAAAVAGNATNGFPQEAGFQLVPIPRGALDSIRPAALDISEAKDGCHLMQVQATGLNFRDVLNCLGAYPGDPGRG